MKRFFSLAAVVGLILVPAFGARGDVKLPAVFGNAMVLQQDTKIPIWGWADPGEKIQVSLGGQQIQTQADAQGKWRVEFGPLPTTTTPMILAVAGKNAIQFQDIVVGEVWVASGQSNMAYPLIGTVGAKDAIAQADDPLLRIYDDANRPGIRPKTIGAGYWYPVTTNRVGGTSAVAYYFGRQLRQKLNRPVGLIEGSWGGTPIETWMSADALRKIPDTEAGLAEIAKQDAAFPHDPAQQQAAMDDWGKRVNDWENDLNRPYVAAIQKWQADVAAARAANQPLPPEPPRPPVRPKSPDGQEGDYTTLFNGMIAPLAGFPIRGVIWYQGEANTGDKQPRYEAKLSGLIDDWRRHWGNNFTFLVVGLANNGRRSPTPEDSGWAEVRGAQSAVTASMPNTGLAQTIEIGTGNNIHPPDKLDVGLRLAASALHVAYGQNVPYDGPRFASMAVEAGKIRVKYTNADSGLAILPSPYISNDPTNDNPPLSTTDVLGFEIAGADKKWVNARAQIDGKEVLVWSDTVPQPVAVRFAWAWNPPVNLYNKDGFPAVPFRTQDWPVTPPAR